VSLAEGKPEAWIVARTGHQSSEMLYRYRRQADTHRESNLGLLVPMHEAIPELAETSPEILDEAAGVPVGVPSPGPDETASPMFALPPDICGEELASLAMAPAPGLEPGWGCATGCVRA
jgi:hypothetical protein